MIDSYIYIYQYFENEEYKLSDRITYLQNRCLYTKDRVFTKDDLIELTEAKIKLDFVRKISSEILKVLSRFNII